MFVIPEVTVPMLRRWLDSEASWYRNQEGTKSWGVSRHAAHPLILLYWHGHHSHALPSMQAHGDGLRFGEIARGFTAAEAQREAAYRAYIDALSVVRTHVRLQDVRAVLRVEEQGAAARPNKRVYVDIEEGQKQALTRCSQEEGVPVNVLVQDALHLYLAALPFDEAVVVPMKDTVLPLVDFGIRLPGNERTLLHKEARRLRVPVSVLVRTALSSYLTSPYLT